MPLRTHLSVLEECAALYSSRPAFRIPHTDSEEIESWSTVTYSQFKSDVEAYARYWASTLAADGIPTRSVVGLWSVASLPVERLTSRSPFTPGLEA